jgi:hypothetical protein
VQLRSIRKQHPIFQRLAYGTLGHYSSAAMRWGLVDASARKLLPFGEALAKAFSSRRRDLPFSSALSGWISGDIVSQSTFEAAGIAYSLDASPSSGEQSAWQSIIQSWCSKHPQTEILWRRPLSAQTIAIGLSETAKYQTFWETATENYSTLQPQIDAIQRFERLAAATQFMFDLHVAVLEFGERFNNTTPRNADAFARAVVQLAKTYTGAPAFEDARRLFATIAASAENFRSLTRCVVEHHMEHQKAKGTLPIVNHNELLMTGRADADNVSKALSDFESAGNEVDDVLARLQYRYRRQWHFEKCRRWHDWATQPEGTMQ